MASSVKVYVRACSVCQQAKYSTLPLVGLLHPLPVPTQTWQDIDMNFITGLPLSHGYFVILVVVDRLSKFAYFIPLPTDFSAPKVADSFIHTVVSVHGLPHSILSYRDKVFTSKFWEQICKRQGITVARSSAYHPQTNGQTEVLNRCLEMYLRCYTQANPKDWYQFLPWAAYYYNSSFHTAIGMSPYKVVFGKEPPSVLRYKPQSGDTPSLQEQLQTRDVLSDSLKQNIQKAQLRMKIQADHHRRELEYNVGDFVYVKL